MTLSLPATAVKGERATAGDASDPTTGLRKRILAVFFSLKAKTLKWLKFLFFKIVKNYAKWTKKS